MTRHDTVAPRLPWEAANPYPFYRQSRATGDVVWDDTAGAWLILGYDAARQVLGGPGWTSDPLANPGSRDAMDPISADFTGSSMLFADGAAHQRIRGSVRDVFTRSFIEALTRGVESVVAAVTSHPCTGTSFDFMSEIALPIPLAVIAEWLNLSPETSAVLREQSPVIVRMLGALADADEVRAGAAASAALMAEFLPLAADRRAHPGDDLLSFLAADPALDLDEVAMTAILIAVAGHETTANLLGAGLVRLLTTTVDGVRLADAIDPADPATITELLRLDAPVQSTVRTATHDHHIAGTAIAAGQSALVAVAAANRDPKVFDQPEIFRPRRAGPAPLSFGYGAHYCLGAALARLEITAALRRVLDRRPELAGAVTWRDTPAIRGPHSVPIVFTND
ncbi:cytochrome P450 [Mycolicibacterium hippocampi]|uniref:Putative cytochrome P450 hydroxylase n=1 Tax=Mycolicibacterium hippocampi TaxID=659824 RepID=A0A850PM14_9MYCO|nr:cytochrome P450 [Mycolicibacterium hippocampi]NVN49354.1 putative cytochrome P450 hydroxylase [Mycolicibacterium hippocampi]